MHHREPIFPSLRLIGASLLRDEKQRSRKSISVSAGAGIAIALLMVI
jgi:hypothetical protein